MSAVSPAAVPSGRVPAGRVPSATGLRVRRDLGVRLLRSELRIVFGRRRNQLILGALALIPVIIAVAVKINDNGHNQVDGLIGSITDNGIFVAFTALVVVIPIFLPMSVSVVVGEAIAGEAGTGTLRYLLTVPVSRTRLLAVKLVAAFVWCLVSTAVVALTGMLIGFILFPRGRVTLLSGTQTSLTDGIWRLSIVVGYASLMMLAIAVLGLFISTLTEVPIAAMAATLSVAITMQVLDAVPQLHAIHPWLISDYLLRFADVLRDPLILSGLGHGSWVALGYLAVFTTAAWARFSGKDITS